MSNKKANKKEKENLQLEDAHNCKVGGASINMQINAPKGSSDFGCPIDGLEPIGYRLVNRNVK